MSALCCEFTYASLIGVTCELHFELSTLNIIEADSHPLVPTSMEQSLHLNELSSGRSWQ